MPNPCEGSSLEAVGEPPKCGIGLWAWLQSFYYAVCAALAEAGEVTGTVPIGMGAPYFGGTVPTGWLLCDGAEVSRTAYADLFTAIGVTYGAGNGTTTFNLPDSRGRTLIGKDNMGGTSANRVTDPNADVLGGSGGAENHVLTASQLPTTPGTVYIWDSTPTGTTPTSTNRITTTTAVSSSNSYNKTVPAHNEGGGQAHNNLQPWMAVNAIIYAGV